MSKWNIYSKDGKTIKAVAYEIEYNGEFMGESFVTTTVESPEPIDFQIGDYIIYRNEVFTINYDPTELKQNYRLTSIDSFKYDSIKFNSYSDELTRCDFLDYVLSDNQMHFTALPTFSFFAASVRDLADRIQANLDRIYSGEKKWTIAVSDEFTDSVTDINISASNISAWDALALVNSEFNANFVIKGRTITIGTNGMIVDKVFGYGKDNGLCEIQKIADQDQAIITRLRAYGNTTNMPMRYYNKLSGADGVSMIPDNMAVSRLMLPAFPYSTLDPYIDSSNVGELGVREGTVFFDGSVEGCEDIYPTLKGVTAEELVAAGIATISTGRLDEVVDAEQITDNGVFETDGETIAPFKIYIKDIGFDINDYLSTESASISFTSGMCGGREFEIVKCEKTSSGYTLTCNRVFDDDINLYFPYKSYNIKAGDRFVLLNIQMPDVYIKAASQRLLSAAQVYLAKNDYVRYTYEPKINNVFMQKQHDNAIKNGKKSIHDTIKEGDIFVFEDEDLNISGSIIIDTLNIKEGSSQIPEYSITLRNDKAVGTIQRLQNQIDSIASGGQGGGGYNKEQINSLIKLFGDSNYLSKIKPDTAKGKITFDDGARIRRLLESDGFIDSLLAGKGFGITQAGRGQFESLEVRGSMKVMELIINEISLMQGDYSFSDGGYIERVEAIADRTYKLYIRKEMPTDIAPFKSGDVLYSIINNLRTGGTDYYTSWMRAITNVNNEDNSIEVVLWDDEESPTGQNYPPQAGYNITRRGNAVIPEEGEINERSQSWLLSSREGRIMFLANVYKPILADNNYALSIGKIPNLKALDHLPIEEGALGIVAQYGIFNHIYEYDYNGDVKTNMVDRGEWSLAVAQSESPYRNQTLDKVADDGKHVYTLLEQHTVWHFGCKWGCLKDKTTVEPFWNSPDWVLREGNKNYSIEFYSDNGTSFRLDSVRLNLTAKVKYAGMDITDELLAASGTQVSWTRDTGNAPMDAVWKPKHVNDAPNVINITREDMGSGWGIDYKSVKFVCQIFIPDGEVTIENEITAKI